MEVRWYKYTPSIGAAITAVIIFSILLSIHTFRLFKTRTWFCIPFIIGATCEVLDYGARAFSHYHLDYSTGSDYRPESVAATIVQCCLILLAPIFFAASVYMFLGRIMTATSCGNLSPIRPRFVTWIFVMGNWICLNVQGAGAGMLTNPHKPGKVRNGKKIVLFGLWLQVLVLLLFVYVAAVFHSRIRSGPQKQLACKWDWERYLVMLYVVSVIISVRNVFRVVEYAMGTDGYLMIHVWPMYVFDTILMAIVLGVCTFWYGGRFFRAQQQGHNRDSYDIMVSREVSEQEKEVRV